MCQFFQNILVRHSNTGRISNLPKIISKEKMSNRGSDNAEKVVEGVSRTPTAGPILDRQLKVPEIASNILRSKKVVAAAEIEATKK